MTDSTLAAAVAAFAAAEKNGDQAPMQSLLADDFIAQGPAGFVLSREAWLGRYRSGEFGYESYELIDVNIREYDGFAVVNAVQNQRAN